MTQCKLSASLAVMSYPQPEIPSYSFKWILWTYLLLLFIAVFTFPTWIEVFKSEQHSYGPVDPINFNYGR